MKKWTPCVVVWKDAVTYHDPADSGDDFPLVTRRTIGFFLKQTTEGVTVCMEDDRHSKDGSADCQTVTTIPQGMIVEVLELQLKPKKLPKRKAA